MPLDSLRELEAARGAYRGAVASGDEERIKAAAIWLVQSEIRHDRALGIPVVSTRAQRVLPFVLIIALLAAIGIAALGIDRSSDTADQVRPIIESPCQADPASRACARFRLEIILNEPRFIPCTSLRRVFEPEAIEKFTRCRAIEQEQREKGDPDAPAPPRQTLPTGPTSLDPVPPGSGSGGDGNGGDSVPPPPDPGDPSPPTPTPTPEPPPPPPGQPDPPSLGGAVGETVTGVCTVVNNLGLDSFRVFITSLPYIRQRCYGAV